MLGYQNYVEQISNTLVRLPWDQIEATVATLDNARLAGRQIFVMGNGGSASTASHLACDLDKNTAMPEHPRFRVIALTDNMAYFSACANDYGYQNVFAEQLANLLRPDDVVLGISTSGNSSNVLEAVRLANAHGVTTIGWTGYDGGLLADMVDIPVVVDNDCVEQIEDIHLILAHMTTVALRQRIRAEAPRKLALEFAFA